ncbi:class I SAM-dependent methyltransferase [Ornithinibacillus californiensis]|uniref:class I SAM-dependent methyltransferase n=1 Tax=Ornithinibacillus californiensis TaxID=161536 RepID=UPI00064DB169|nr:class I SAM-dependent methyltransferase [Ornithinibacillus californiensis]
MNETISNYEDLLEMLDSFLREPTQFWDGFYQDRNKPIPFFQNKPDENLVSYYKNGFISSGKVLELGCGPGRNAIYLAKNGFKVDAVDISKETIEWARERAKEANVDINFIIQNIFHLHTKQDTYDLVYDSGCFHHLAPHRRMDYINLVNYSLKPGGYFALTCFVTGGKYGGSDITDWEVYRLGNLQGGLGFNEEKLRHIFKDFEVVEIRKMIDMDTSSAAFGTSALWTGLFRKK